MSDVDDDVPENNSDRTLSKTERFYSVGIFVIFVLFIVGIWEPYVLIAGVSLGLILVVVHLIVQKYSQNTEDKIDLEAAAAADVCERSSKEDVCDELCTTEKDEGTRLAQSSRRKSTLPSVTEVEIASHFFHQLGAITEEVPVEDLEDEGLGNDAFEVDIEDVTCGTSPPTYSDCRFFYYQ